MNEIKMKNERQMGNITTTMKTENVYKIKKRMEFD